MYCHFSKDTRKKLEPTIEMGVFVGYTKTQHNYRVYFASHKVTVVRIDVKFDEEKAMRCSLKREMSIPPKNEIIAPKVETHVELQDVVEQPKVEE